MSTETSTLLLITKPQFFFAKVQPLLLGLMGGPFSPRAALGAASLAVSLTKPDYSTRRDEVDEGHEEEI